ncbi:hypothetical protein [Geoalkalibacter halelectricus]|uniref:Uncharacterized protein n=1 Tax=Geoalkalibacter halelectricus TaxID=2847045 RepID=A0ABY5ZSK5_9BACT|nr:hypothetical protein [Geoalkalibacter halelectricus]MDO3379172.1 hypothetical protein [Geoalkalibacter halelectricus]UWZ80932.1 hypothetical protein L9S41_05880 [Geoalkalibacter halelectricus]
MANTNVFTGAHGTLTLAPLDTAEGRDAGSVIEAYDIQQAVGRVVDVKVCVKTDLEAFHEIGRRYPTSLHPGNINISGTVGRAYINGALLGLLLGRKSFLSSTTEPFVQPAFNMTLRLDDPATVGSAELVINGVQLQNWSFNLPEDEFVMEEVSFKALSVDIIDVEDTVTVGPIFID